MRILFTRFPLESAYGGAEVQTLALMQGLRDREHEVSFLGSCPVLLKRTSPFAKPTSPRLRVPRVAQDRSHCAKATRAKGCAGQVGLRTSALDIGPPPVTKWGAISFLWRKRGMQEKLTQTLSSLVDHRSSIDALCMLSISEKLLLTDWAHAHGIHVFWIEHDRVGRWLTRNPWIKKLERLSSLATTIVVSELSKNIYEKLGWRGKIVAIPNGVDPEHLAVTRHSSHVTRSGHIRIGCIARLTGDKGVDLLIKAIREFPSVTLEIIGSGRKERTLSSLIESLSLQERVTIRRATSDIGAFYRTLDILALPSREHDPFGLSAAEAMILGIPVIVTNACGIAGYLQNMRDALIVEANSHRALAEAISALLDPALQQHIGDEGRHTAEERFSLEGMIDAYERLLCLTGPKSESPRVLPALSALQR